MTRTDFFNLEDLLLSWEWATDMDGLSRELNIVR